MSLRTPNSRIVSRILTWSVLLVLGAFLGTAVVGVAQEVGSQKDEEKENSGMSEDEKTSDIWIRLKARKQQLDERENQLNEKAERLKKLEKKIEGEETSLKKNVKELAAKEGPCAKVASKILQGKKYNLEKIMPRILDEDKRKEIRKKRIQRLSRKVKQMRATKAANLLVQMEEKLAVSVLGELNARSSGAILNEMPSKKAAGLSQKLVETENGGGSVPGDRN